MLLCRESLPMPRLHERPWSPRSSTQDSQIHRWASQTGKPKRMPTPTQTASSSKRRPQEAIGSALSQSPAWGDATARSRALSCGVSTDDSRRALPFDTAGPSQLRCFMASVPVGGAAPIEPHHKSSMGATEGSGRSQLSPKMADWRTSVAAADDRKADGASITTLRIPSPPTCIGRLA